MQGFIEAARHIVWSHLSSHSACLLIEYWHRFIDYLGEREHTHLSPEQELSGQQNTDGIDET